MSDRAARTWRTSYRAALVCPVATQPIADGAVLVEGDRIAWVGPARDHPPAPDARVVELGDAVLTPGLVNAHTHLDLTVLRGVLDGLPFFEWIRAVVAARARLTPEETLDSARLGAIVALESGITTVADTAPTPASFDAMLEQGLRGIAFIEVFGPDPARAADAIAGLAAQLDALSGRASPLVGLGVSPHAPYSVSDALYRAATAHARTRRLPIATHVAESADESAFVSRGEGAFAGLLAGRSIAVAPRGRTPVDLLAGLGVLGHDALLIHCAECDGRDVATIAAAGAAVAACPHSNRYFGHARAPVRALLEAGVRVGVGTDSLASNDAMDVLAEAGAMLGQPGTALDGGVLERATLRGAEALGLSNLVGTLEPGKQADLAAFPTAPASREVRRTRASLVVVAGVARVQGGRVQGSPDRVRARNADVAGRLREWRTGGAGA